MFLSILNLAGNHNPYFGILDSVDLQREAAWAKPNSIITRGAAFNLWQCLDLDKLEMKCAERDSSEGMKFAQAVLTIHDGGQTFEFDTRRPVESEACQEILKNWREVFNGEIRGCVSASYGFGEPMEVFGPWQRTSYWIINWIKTRHSHWSYFIENIASSGHSPRRKF